MPRTPIRTASPRVHDVPLPGIIQCVTLQMNATYYRSGRGVRWVVIVRDPDGNTELDRLSGALQEDGERSLASMLEDLQAGIDSARYQLFGNAIKLKEVLSDTQQAEAAPRTPRKRKVS